LTQQVSAEPTSAVTEFVRHKCQS